MGFTLLLALLIYLFLFAGELFGYGSALFSLALFVFDPNFLAHGAGNDRLRECGFAHETQKAGRMDEAYARQRGGGAGTGFGAESGGDGDVLSAPGEKATAMDHDRVRWR